MSSLAAAIAGDTTKSRQAYQDFFALWKDADADIPILIEAKQEYEKLNSYVRYPTWSPLGDKIAFEYAETTGNI